MMDYRFLDFLMELPCVEKIILFGSRARGDYFTNSDIDLAIEAPTANEKDWLKILQIIDDADTLLKLTVYV